MKKFQFSGMNAGSATLLVIFMTICLTMLALLSVASSNADLKLTEKMSDSIESYYRADSKAQEIIAEIDSIYADMSAKKLTESDALSFLSEELNKISDVNSAIEKDGENALISFNVSHGKTGKLSVALKVPLKINVNEHYKIEEYRIIPNEQDGYEEENLDLWDGTIPE